MRWPTSELPIWPDGSPTASPDAASVACGYRAQSASKTGVSASSTAFPGPGGASPQPSRMTRTTGLKRASAPARQIASNDGDVERRAADERAVHVRLRQERRGVVRASPSRRRAPALRGAT